uniref:HTH myb-type domain-containing protein n=1 Tax=Macrostomum lignano TaxID=282301 RepID=A0A1I8FMK9_9PLAT
YDEDAVRGLIASGGWRPLLESLESSLRRRSRTCRPNWGCLRARVRQSMSARNDEDAQAKVSSRGRQRQRGRRQQEKPQLESGGRVTAAVRNLFGGLWSSLTTGPAQPVLGTPVDLNRPMLLD